MWHGLTTYCYNKMKDDKKAAFLEKDVDLLLMSDADKKKAIILLLDDIVQGTTSSIDKATAELILKSVIKSVGNEITAFVVRK